jgi:hypothetical protein
MGLVHPFVNTILPKDIQAGHDGKAEIAVEALRSSRAAIPCGLKISDLGALLGGDD